MAIIKRWLRPDVPYFDQQENQDPKMEVTYHLKPEELGLHPLIYIAVKNRPYRLIEYILQVPPICLKFQVPEVAFDLIIHKNIPNSITSRIIKGNRDVVLLPITRAFASACSRP